MPRELIVCLLMHGELLDALCAECVHIETQVHVMDPGRVFKHQLIQSLSDGSDRVSAIMLSSLRILEKHSLDGKRGVYASSRMVGASTGCQHCGAVGAVHGRLKRAEETARRNRC